MTTDTEKLAADIKRVMELDIEGKRDAIGFRELYEYEYDKYGEHVVAIKCNGGGLRLFDAVNLFSENNSRKEYERVKNEASEFAKAMTSQFNAAPLMAAIIRQQGEVIRAQHEALEHAAHWRPFGEAIARHIDGSACPVQVALALSAPLVKEKV